MHTKQDGYENKRKEYTPPRLSPKHRSSAKRSTKTNSERLSVTKRASESISKRKDDWTTEKMSSDDLRNEMDKRKKDREGEDVRMKEKEGTQKQGQASPRRPEPSDKDTAVSKIRAASALKLMRLAH